MKPSQLTDVNNDRSPPVIESATHILQQETIKNTSNKDFHNSQSILKSIAEYNLHKLENRQKQNVQDKDRIVKLTGMTVYDWNRDWVFFN